MPVGRAALRDGSGNSVRTAAPASSLLPQTTRMRNGVSAWLAIGIA
jgi:hypothetical protein